MKERLAQFKATHWDTLSTAEQRTLRRAAWILAPLLAWGLLWQPAHDALPALQTKLPQLRAQLAQMEVLAGEAQNLRQRAQVAVLDGTALRAAVERSAGEAGLALTVTPAEQDCVQIDAESVPFAQWQQWLHTLQDNLHVRVSSLMLTATPTPGLVKIQATLTNGVGQ